MVKHVPNAIFEVTFSNIEMPDAIRTMKLLFWQQRFSKFFLMLVVLLVATLTKSKTCRTGKATIQHFASIFSPSTKMPVATTSKVPCDFPLMSNTLSAADDIASSRREDRTILTGNEILAKPNARRISCCSRRGSAFFRERGTQPIVPILSSRRSPSVLSTSFFCKRKNLHSVG